MLTGCVNALNNSMLTGWAVDTASPGEHLTIHVLQGSRRIAAGVANILRPDLPGIDAGSGDHTFRIEVPSAVRSLDSLVVVAESRRNGEQVLPGAGIANATGDKAAIDTSTPTSLREELDRLRRMIEGAGDAIGSAEDIAERLRRLEARMDSAEVFFVRIDEMVRGLVEEKKKRRKRFLGIF